MNSMNPNPKSFEFTSYKINKEKSAIIFSYEMAFFNAAPIQFSETISFRESFSLENIPVEKFEKLIGEYLYTQKLPHGQDIVDMLPEAPKILGKNLQVKAPKARCDPQ